MRSRITVLTCVSHVLTLWLGAEQHGFELVIRTTGLMSLKTTRDRVGYPTDRPDVTLADPHWSFVRCDIICIYECACVCVRILIDLLRIRTMKLKGRFVSSWVNCVGNSWQFDASHMSQSSVIHGGGWLAQWLFIVMYIFTHTYICITVCQFITTIKGQ